MTIENIQTFLTKQMLLGVITISQANNALTFIRSNKSVPPDIFVQDIDSDEIIGWQPHIRKWLNAGKPLANRIR